MTPSKTPSTCAEPRGAADSEPGVRRFLAELLADRARHGRWLNTLSLMEHIGSRKIMLSQGESSDEQVLKHLSEETRHAHFFRRAAEKEAGRPVSYADAELAAPASARLYFGRLDAGLSRVTGPGALAYLYVTQAIEVRAGWLYALYERVLREAGHPLSLRSVIVEEDLHLAQMDAELSRRDPLYAQRAPRFLELEGRLFDAWFARTRAALSGGEPRRA